MNKLRITRNCIEITCDKGDDETVSYASSFYPITSNRSNTNFKLSPRKLLSVLKLFRDIDSTNIDTAPSAIQDLFHKENLITENIKDLLTNGARKTCVVNENLTLMPHQQLGREIATYLDKYAFFYDTRTGKTPLALSIINDDITAHPDHKWLVVCPLILINNAWLEDVAKFFPNMKVVNCHASTRPKRMAQLQKAGNLYVTNTESFVSYSEHFYAMHFDGCFVDESSSMKSFKSKISVGLVDFAQTLKRFYLLSGTPAPNGEYEYYMQLKAIDYYGVPKSFSQFKQHFFVDISFNSNFEKLMLRPDKSDELLELVKQYSLYVDKEDVLTTPGRTFEEYTFDLNPALKDTYKTLKNDLYIELNADNQKVTITAPSIAAKLNKLNQVTSGFAIDTKAKKENKFYGDTNKEWYLLDHYRFDKLMELLSSKECVGEQVLIWANYHIEFEIIQGLLGNKCACVYGATSITDKDKAIKDFKAGKIQYLVANPASADKGLTLTNTHIAIYFSLTWSYELFKQSMDRIYGDISKQPKHCLYYIMMANGTIDTVLYREVLRGKGSASYAILNHLKSGERD